MSSVVLDASALLAALFREDGADRVQKHLPGAKIAAVNLSEVAAKLIETGVTLEKAIALLASQSLEVIDFDTEAAYLAASIQPATRPFGLSLADRACLALGLRLGIAVVTADRAWSKVPLPVKVVAIR